MECRNQPWDASRVPIDKSNKLNIDIDRPNTPKQYYRDSIGQTENGLGNDTGGSAIRFTINVWCSSSRTVDLISWDHGFLSTGALVALMITRINGPTPGLESLDTPPWHRMEPSAGTTQFAFLALCFTEFSNSSPDRHGVTYWYSRSNQW